MSLSVRYRQRTVILAVAALIVIVAVAIPGFGEAQDATPAPTEQQLIEQGEDIYSTVCLACHQPAGEGITVIFPALNGNPLITGEDPAYFVEVVLNGRGGMPRFADTYDDAEIAAVTTYVRQAWDNDASPVDPELVAQLRGAMEDEDDAAATPEPETQAEAVSEGTPEATPEA